MNPPSNNSTWPSSSSLIWIFSWCRRPVDRAAGFGSRARFLIFSFATWICLIWIVIYWPNSIVFRIFVLVTLAFWFWFFFIERRTAICEESGPCCSGSGDQSKGVPDASRSRLTWRDRGSQLWKHGRQMSNIHFATKVFLLSSKSPKNVCGKTWRLGELIMTSPVQTRLQTVSGIVYTCPKHLFATSRILRHTVRFRLPIA